jgi:hypothetical protein
VTARTFRSVVAPAALVAALGAPAAAAGQAAPPADAPSKLAVLTAAGGSLRDGVLTLRGVGARATWFVDRPFHQAGTAPTWSLVPAYFKAGSPAPNAAIEIAGRRGGADTVIVELSRPAIDRARRTLRFAARVLPDAPDRLASWRARRLAAAPGRFGRVSVFLDTESQSCTGVVQLATSGVAGINPQTSVSYGGWIEVTAQTLSTGGTQAFTQNGSMFTGCGGSMTYVLVQADGTTPVPGGTSGLLTLNWGDPEIGSNSASCSVSYPGLSCTVADQGGDNPTWTYVVYPG